MNWASAIATESRLVEAITSAAASLRATLQEGPLDLAVLFVSRQYVADLADAPAILRDQLPFAHLLGCTAGGVIGGGHEIEQQPAISLVAAQLPGVAVRPFTLTDAQLPDDDAGPRAWTEALGVAAEPQPHFLLLADPFTFTVPRLLAGLDYAYPHGRKIGGLASGATRPGGNLLFLDHAVQRAGAVGLALTGDVDIATIVAQGCRPIGHPQHITRCRGNLLLELDDQPALEALKRLIPQLSSRDRKLASQALFLGMLMDELAASPQPGEFLIRNIVGMDTESGALVVGELLREGQTVQFHVRDAETSAEDLENLLGHYTGNPAAPAAAGALLFSCLGRGLHLYGVPDHDTSRFRAHLGEVPLGGFFCNGEIGPVSGSTRLHGFTSAFGIFGPARTDP
jgi:small ligand-binding sensory domain FIST